MPKITANISGGTADFCTDYGTTPEGVTCHLPLNKIVWGDSTTSYKANETYPLPVQVMAVTGGSLTMTGNLGASGNFPIINRSISGATTAPFIEYIAVAGSTTGDTLGITGTIRLATDGLEAGGITISEVTNRGWTLSSATDTVTVSGEVGISGGSLNLNSGTDSVSVFGHDGGRYIQTQLHGANGTTIGASGDAINVNLVNSGITFEATIAAVVGITNAGFTGAGTPSEVNTALRVQGCCGGEPIRVAGRVGEAIEVVNYPGGAVGVTADNLKVTVEGYSKPSTFVSGLTVAAFGTTASQLVASSTPLQGGVTIKSHPSNLNFVYVGNSGLTAGDTGNAYPLESGESLFLEISNLNLVYVLGISGDARKVNFIGS
tara:strand:- start:13104 stop:14231 length:1128 start_codon:yes stop_codon:yes gene_type:complete